MFFRCRVEKLTALSAFRCVLLLLFSLVTLPSHCTTGGTAAAVVAQVAPSAGPWEGGQLVTISGSGFSMISLENQVWIQGIPCAVVAANTNSLLCVTGRLNDRWNVTAAGVQLTAGVALMEWWHNVDCCLPALNFQRLVRGDSLFLPPSGSVLTSRVGRDYDAPMACEYCCHKWTTYLLAPLTGVYTFNAVVDDCVELWISPNSNSAAAARIFSCGNKYQVTGTTTLTAGRRYWLRAFLGNVGGPQVLTISIVLPNGTGAALSGSLISYFSRPTIRIVVRGIAGFIDNVTENYEYRVSRSTSSSHSIDDQSDTNSHRESYSTSGTPTVPSAPVTTTPTFPLSNTTALTVSASRRATLSATTALTPSAPLPVPVVRSAGAQAALASIIPPQAAVVVVATATATSGSAGAAFAPGIAAQATRSELLASLGQCGANSNPADQVRYASALVPDTFSYVYNTRSDPPSVWPFLSAAEGASNISFPMPAVTVNSAAAAQASGVLVTTSALLAWAVMLVGCTAILEKKEVRSTFNFAKVANRVGWAAWSLFSPNVVVGCALVLRFSAAPIAQVVAVVALILNIGVVVGLSYALVFVAPRVFDVVSNKDSAGLLDSSKKPIFCPKSDVDARRQAFWLEGLCAVVYEGATADCMQRPMKRLYYVEELMVNDALGVAVALGSAGGGFSCDAAVDVAVVCVVGHAAYLGVWRPYYRRLDTLFSGLSAALSVLQSAALGVVVAGDAATSAAGAKLLGSVTLVQSLFFVVQLAGQCFWVYVVHRRNRRRRQTAKEHAKAAEKDTDGELHYPDHGAADDANESLHTGPGSLVCEMPLLEFSESMAGWNPLTEATH